MLLMSRQAVALALLASSSTAALAQAPAAPQPIAHQVRMAPPLPITNAPALRFGRSRVTALRSGSPASTTLALRAVTGLISSLDPWAADGPAALTFATGAFGAYSGSPRYDTSGIFQNMSGRIAAIAADPTNANIYYIASAGGGVWKTTDAGQSYTALTDFLGDTAMGSVTVAPSNSSIIYAGTGEANSSGDSRYGIGLLKSTDGGATWSVIPGPTSPNSPQGVFYRKAISRIVVSPTDPNTVYLGTVSAGLNGNGNADGGVWKTTDGGVNWTNTTAAFLTSAAYYTDVAMNSHNPNILYTAVGAYFSFSGNGVFKTTNGGQTWARLTGGLPQPSSALVGGETALALYSSTDGTSDTLYASIPNSSTQGLLGLYKSSDSGATFTKLNAPNYLGGQGFYDNAIAVSPSSPNVFFAAGQVNYDAINGGTTNFNDLRTLIGTTNGGATFSDFSLGGGLIGPHTDTHAVAFTPDGKVLDGNDGGIWRLENPLVANPTPPSSQTNASGSNIQWTDINGNLNTLQLTGIALDPTNAANIYGGAQDNGTSKLSSTGWFQVRGGDGGFTRLDPSNPQTVYHEYYGISLERSDDGGQTWNGAVNGINQGDNDAGDDTSGDGTDSRAFYVPYKLDPLNTSDVIYGTDHVYLSTNKGNSFTAIGIPGTNGFATSLPAGSFVNTLGVVGSTIYAEAATHIYATFNNGASWSERSIPAIVGAVHVSDITVNTGNPQDLYATKGAFDGSTVGKIFRSTNGGQTWANITGNLPNIPFSAVRLDQKSGTLYAGGDDGVYSSTNYGGSWARIPGSMPTVAVVDLDLSSPTGLLGAGTHGRGIWTTPLSTVVAKPNVTVVTSLARTSASTVAVTVTVSNFGNAALPIGVGNADALNTTLSISLGGQTGAPVAVGPVPAYGKSQSVTLSFTGVPTGYASLRYNGTYTGGSFSGTQRVSVP